MGRMLEDVSKTILKEHGVPVPGHAVISVSEEITEHHLSKPCVLKALVPVGKRGKAGAIKFADTVEEARSKADEIFGMTVRNFPVDKVLIEEKIDIDEEWYVSITIDPQKQVPVVIATTEGGVEVEDLVRDSPEKVVVYHVEPFTELHPYQSKEIWSRLGVTGKPLGKATAILCKLYNIFLNYDCYILEINPLVLTRDEKVMAAASVMGVDDSALYRHPELEGKVESGSERSWRPLTQLEKEMVKVNDADYRGTARYTEMDGGEIGFMCGGGGGSLLSFDALINLGASPANYSETGGNPPEEKVTGLTKGILSKEGVRSLFVAHNITNNTQIDVFARGIVKAIEELGVDPETFPIVVREAGVNDEEGKRIFLEAGITYFGEDLTMEEAAAEMVKKMRGVS
ncbi:ATP-grasp domain-containing protein [Cytobacillus firmus]|uniref:ATP-grasp domain-containing protein n=1 Tax=Cytobacillus firmus TaxID=1399 RepID=UPI0018CD8B40|nr:ATP-grasp domain-containing protein [Cytobacillus firmus]MBG9653977.1 succinate--CoA ligase [Cytobacillus firmus]MED1908616.1 ATP citrate lyase citrate-binding domain-containing protein [Cytobacillus firmus]